MKRSNACLYLNIAVWMFLNIAIASWAVEVSRNGEYVLTDFGDATTSAAAQETMDKACKWIVGNGGGTLIIPSSVTVPFEIKNIYQKSVMGSPSVTIQDRRKGNDIEYLPSMGHRSPSGWTFGKEWYRLVNLKEGGLPFQGNFQAMSIRNSVVRGATSYDQAILEAVEKGENRRIYVPTIRGIFIGQNLVLTGGAFGYAPPFDYLVVKEIGWDTEKKVSYLVADLKNDHPKAALLYDKHVTGSLSIGSTSNCDNQTMELAVGRRQYGHGDSMLISGLYVYQGNVFSGLGDERGVVVNAEVSQDPNPFHGTVESVNWKDNAIIIKPGLCNIQKLATSRPLINMNQKKWITGGTVMIVPPDDWPGFIFGTKENDPMTMVKEGISIKDFPLMKDGVPRLKTCLDQPVKNFKYTFKGRAYPSLIFNYVNYLGGCIIGSPDCNWTSDVIGRYFAVAIPDEYLSQGERTAGVFFPETMGKRNTYRWYLIKQFRKNADGTCVIKIERVRFSAVDAGAPVLYNSDNYTWDNHERPLKYIIAPGSLVYDVGDAWKDTASGEVLPSDPRTIRLVTGTDRGTAFDFASDDPIEQAIGADPAIPLPIRIRVFNNVPDTMEAAGVAMSNPGKVAMHAGVSIRGSGNNRDEVAKRKDRQPPWITGLEIASITENGVVFGADVTNSALLFVQPNEHEQPIKWKHSNGETTLAVDPKNGDMSVQGGTLAVSGVRMVKGLSGSEISAKNLRQINLKVPAGSKQLEVKFAELEADANYAVMTECSWNTLKSVKDKKAEGFTIVFEKASPDDGGFLDWVLIR